MQKEKNIIINNADKGDAVVIMGVEKYINEANRQLSDKRNCKKLQEDPTILIWLTIQLIGLKKKIYFLKNWLTAGNTSTQKPLSFTFHTRYIKKTTQEDQ